MITRGFLTRRSDGDGNSSLAYDLKKGLYSRVTTIFFFVLTIFLFLSSLVIVSNPIGVNAPGSVFYGASAQEVEEEKSDEEILSDNRNMIQKLADEYFKALKGGEDGEEEDDDNDNILSDAVEKALSDKDPEGFGYLLTRFFGVRYLNETPQASNHGDTGGINCNLFDSLAGTVMYHNCDVPNVMTQFVQSLASSFVQFGPIGAEKSSAHISNTAFGLPDDIPNGGAPIFDEDRLAKYTALELFGYNFNYSSYKGEWDDIRVQNSARSMSGMGAWERVRATFKAYSRGLGHATEVAVEEFTREISSGDIMGAIGGFFGGLVTGGVSATVNSILDTMDQNIFNQNAWYRVNFAATMYGARELSSEEMAAELQNLVVEYMSGVKVQDVEVPEDLLSIEEPPELPEEAISFCSVVPQTEFTPAPGVNEAECATAHAAASAAAAAAALPPPPFIWSEDGVRTQEPLRQYIDNYPTARNNIPPNYFIIAQKYGLMCFPEGRPEDWDISIPSRQAYGNKIKSCWNEGWQVAVDNKLNVDQNVSTGGNTQEVIDSQKFQDWVNANPNERNYNAPWRRFICLNLDGTDMRGPGNSYVFLYDSNGTRNSECQPTRNPIQNGLFGNGYTDDVNVPKDTRNITEEKTVLATMVPLDTVYSAISNFGLSIAIYATRISNTVINVAYGTTLDKIGLDKIIVNATEKIRDGVYYPLLVLISAIGALVIFFRLLKQKEYSKSFQDLLIMTLTVVFGIILLSKPAEIVEQVEEIPATIEKGILNTVFRPTGQFDGDELCTTSSENTEAVTENDKGHDALSDDSVRRLMCENWRVGAYNIWAFGQFGTSPNNLNVSDMRNTNTDKVGNAQVYLGNGQYMNNWALYQLDTLSSGTASFPDPSNDTGSIPRDFYRIVDMQAGPNNGAGTDDRYYDVWSGQDSSQRMAAGLIGAFASVATAVTVITFAIAKIQVSFVMTIMILIMPFMLLFGLHPTLGRNKMKNYFATLVALGLQRILLAAILAIMFRIMIGIGNSSANVALSCIAMAAIAITFYSIKDSIFKMVFDDVKRFSGENAMVSDDIQKGQLPGYIRNKVDRVKQGADAAAGGIVGGFAAGGVSGAEPAVKRSFNAQMAYIRRIQRYRGKGPVQTFTEAASRAADEARRDIDHDPFAQESKHKALQESKVMKTYAKKAEEYENFEGEERKTFHGVGKFAADGTFLARPEIPTEISTQNLSNRRARKVAKSADQHKKQIIKTDKDLKRRGIHLDEDGNMTKEVQQASFGRNTGQFDNLGNRTQQNFRNRFEDNEPETEHEEENQENKKEKTLLNSAPNKRTTAKRPLTPQERQEINEKIEEKEKEKQRVDNKSKNVYRKAQNREYTKDEMRKALIEAREKAGEKLANRRLF